MGNTLKVLIIAGIFIALAGCASSRAASYPISENPSGPTPIPVENPKEPPAFLPPEQAPAEEPPDEGNPADDQPRADDRVPDEGVAAGERNAELADDVEDAGQEGAVSAVADDLQEDIPEDSPPDAAGAITGKPEKTAHPDYIPDLTYLEIETLWKESPDKLDSISIGVPACGRTQNAVQMPEGSFWNLANPEKQWGTHETVGYIARAIGKVNEAFPETARLTIGNLSGKNGGHLGSHRSHQSGRDVDIGFYHKSGENTGFFNGNASNMDLPRNWAFLKALVAETDVQYVLLDRRIQKLLYDYAFSAGESREWLDQVFKTGDGHRRPIVQHVRRHRNHYHVRFFNPRAQQLGVILYPLIKAKAETSKEPREITHRIRNGECLGSIARRYHTTVGAIQRANRLRGTFLRVGKILVIQGRGGGYPCEPPTPLVVPPRLLPPSPAVSVSDE